MAKNKYLKAFYNLLASRLKHMAKLIVSAPFCKRNHDCEGKKSGRELVILNPPSKHHATQHLRPMDIYTNKGYKSY